jgi:hypothetical protein
MDALVAIYLERISSKFSELNNNLSTLIQLLNHRLPGTPFTPQELFPEQPAPVRTESQPNPTDIPPATWDEATKI